MKNVVAVVYNDEKQVYQTLSDLKNYSGIANVLQAGIVKNDGGKMIVKDGWVDGSDFTSWAEGGLLGAFIGVLAGPIGMLLGSSIGTLIGIDTDDDDLNEYSGVTEKIVREFNDGDLILISIVEEENEKDLNVFFKKYGEVLIFRESEEEVNEEVEHAKKVAIELRKEAKKRMKKEKRKEKDAEWNKKADQLREEIEEVFDK